MNVGATSRERIEWPGSQPPCAHPGGARLPSLRDGGPGVHSGSFADSRPPQIGGHEATIKAVDALFTAVTARNDKLLGDSERQLRALKDAGKLPERLAVPRRGHQGGQQRRREPAAETLYDFMKGQRR